MTTVTEEGGRINVYATEPEIYFTEPMYHNDNAELLNGRLAMLGVICLLYTSPSPRD